MKKYLLPFGFALLLASVGYGIWAVIGAYAEEQRVKEIARSFNEKAITQKVVRVKRLVKAQDVKACMKEMETTAASQDVIECLKDHYIEVRLENR